MAAGFELPKKNPKIRFFHVHFNARKKYELKSELFSIRGNLLISDFLSARILSDTINKKRLEEGRENEQVTPGLLNSIGVMHEIFHFILTQYENSVNPGAFKKALNVLNQQLGESEVKKLQLKFLTEFPPNIVFEGKITPEEYLTSMIDDTEASQIVLEELIILHLENLNPGFRLLKELIDDTPLKMSVPYVEAIDSIESFFESEPTLPGSDTGIIKLLKRPILQHPDDVEEQLRMFARMWLKGLPDELITKILKGTDLLKEEYRLFIKSAGGGTYTPPVPVYDKESFTYKEVQESFSTGLRQVSIDEVSYSYFFEEERFTDDIHWMPRVVMIAKNVFVWLDQLTKKYERPIKFLSDIPDEELDQLQRWKFTALWLIGLWQRSPASKKIKQYCGNHSAESSAYSLFDYVIAPELGGEEAFNNLKERCWNRGIRLASDMVPNHTGIYSKWILEHPDYFIQRDNPPYPSYSFTGPDLSEHPAYQIRIEDKYYSMKDAAVVFQVIENSTGRIRYIYHGNDGTNMPWNDTAQLNLLIPEVREALIQEIFSVARKTPIIRFDAAMTLSKRHYQRLWFPQPGLGGAIPSRSEYAMSKEMFDELLPNEFWRDVVDRFNSEMPDTLLLAEAFWLMEGYFVRTLGMHRVYNSAFMHMFLKEENLKFKQLITNTLEFNPEILKRYVNFMSNPDEETAVNQFGKGDKYFGVAVMMVTLPGLPMFAHGQFEGFTEKYGMEYSRAYYNETPDLNLIKRHEWEICRLLNKRYLFAEVKNFWLYNFISDNGEQNDNVFVFSNLYKNEKALVFYNNSYHATSGYAKYSTGKILGDAQTDENAPLIYTEVWKALELKIDDKIYYIVGETKTGLQYLWHSREIAEKGIHLHLNGYEYKVFMYFEEIHDTNGVFTELYDSLHGKGVPDLRTFLKEMQLERLHNSIFDLFNKENIKELRNYLHPGSNQLTLPLYTKMKISTVLAELKDLGYLSPDETVLFQNIEKLLDAIRVIQTSLSVTNYIKPAKLLSDVRRSFVLNDEIKAGAYLDLILMYAVLKNLLVFKNQSDKSYKSLFDELMLDKPLWQNFIRISDDYQFIRQEFELLHILGEFVEMYSPELFAVETHIEETKRFYNEEIVKQFIGFHFYQNTGYFSKENFEMLAKWDYSLKLIVFFEAVLKSEKIQAANTGFQNWIKEVSRKKNLAIIKELTDFHLNILEISAKSGYIFNDFINNLSYGEQKKESLSTTHKEKLFDEQSEPKPDGGLKSKSLKKSELPSSKSKVENSSKKKTKIKSSKKQVKKLQSEKEKKSSKPTLSINKKKKAEKDNKSSEIKKKTSKTSNKSSGKLKSQSKKESK